MQKHKIKQPKFLKLENQSFDEIKNLLNCPFILKDNFGEKGKKVYLVDNEKQFLKLKNKFNNTALCQEYIEESYGQDIRFIIIGNKVEASAKRVNKNDFRSNLAQGGQGEFFEPTQQQKKLAKKLLEF